jgi:hypothetical protein
MTLAQNFYDQNVSRAWPLDDSASGETDDGRHLPTDVLVDCYLRFPRSAGLCAYVASVHVSEQLVAVTFVAADAPAIQSQCQAISESELPPGFLPLGAVSIPRATLQEFRQYPIEAMYPGVGGWVVFGPARETVPFYGLFSSAAQAMLSPRVARPYQGLPVQSFGKLGNASPLTGLVEIRGGVDVSIRKDTLEIDGHDRQALVLRLESATGENVLDKYRGPCSGRPESRTCDKPAIESINDAVPDCDGNLNLTFVSDCVDVLLDTNGGLVVDFCIDITEACTAQRRRPQNGQLPTDYEDYCQEEEESEIQALALPTPETESDEPWMFALDVPEAGDSHSLSSSQSESCNPLAHVELFGELPLDFDVAHGSFDLSSGYQASSIGKRNLSLWEPVTHHPDCWQHAFTEIELVGAKGSPNGGLVFDYKLEGVVETYYVAEINLATDSFRVRFFDNRRYLTLRDQPRMELKVGEIYTILVELANLGPDVRVTCRLFRGRRSDAQQLAIIEFETQRLRTPGGRFGLHGLDAIPIFYAFAFGVALTDLPAVSEGASSLSVSGSEEPTGDCNLPEESLAVWYRFTESSPTSNRQDQAGSYDLVPIDTVAQTTGVFGGQAVRIVDENYLESEAADPLASNTSYTINLFVRVMALPTEEVVICFKGVPDEFEWMFGVGPTGYFAVVSPNGVTQLRIEPDNASYLAGGALPLGDYVMLTLTYNRPSEELTMSINAAFDYMQRYNADMFAGAGPISIGRGYLSLAGQLTADVAELTVWREPLTAVQRTCLQAGTLTIASVAETQSSESLPSVVIESQIAFWSLNETGVSEMRQDMFHAYPLTPVVPMQYLGHPEAGQVLGVSGLLDGAAKMLRGVLARTRTAGLGGLSPGFTNFTAGGWFKLWHPNDPSMPLGTQTAMGIWSIVPDQREWMLGFSDNGPLFRVSQNGTDTLVANSQLTSASRPGIDEWFFLAGIFDVATGRARVYYNGTFGPWSTPITTVYRGTAPFMVNGVSLNLGTPQYSMSNFWHADDLSFFATALPEAALDAIWNRGYGWQP